jgi:hypothetical protein
MAKSSTYDLITKLSIQTDNFDKNIGDLGKKIDNLEKKLKDSSAKNKKHVNETNEAFKELAETVGIGFSVEKLIELGKECFEVGIKAIGIEEAFEKLNNPALLNELRNATKNTIGDLELMTYAVKANNIGVPMLQLGELINFAGKRARDTGQNVDELVEKLINGIGKKSTKALISLGITADQLKESLHGVALKTADIGQVTEAVLNIAKKSYSETGNEVDNLLVKQQQLKAWWENLKDTIGNGMVITFGWFNDLGTAISNILSSNVMTKWEKFWALMPSNIDNVTNILNKYKTEDEALVKNRTDKYKKNLEEEVLGLKNKEKATQLLNNQSLILISRISDLEKIKKRDGKLDRETNYAYLKYTAEYEATSILANSLDNLYASKFKIVQLTKEELKLQKENAETKAGKELIKNSGTLKYINGNGTKTKVDEFGNVSKSNDYSKIKVFTNLVQPKAKGIDTKAIAEDADQQATYNKWLQNAEAVQQYNAALEETLGITASYSNNFDTIKSHSNTMTATITTMAGAMSDAALQGATSMGELANAAVESGKQVIRVELQKAVAAQMATVFATVPWPFNLVAAAVASSAVMTLANSAMANIPQFAAGAVVSKPTYSMIGEKGTEAILNKMQLGHLVNDLQANNLGGLVEFKIKDNYLVGLLNKYYKKLSYSS